ncbi:hypothetical protein [Pseudomonas sp. AS2.8]|uniref:hypothetical protein n=1 Tax=Pseudomonas sp. AS2.8 TaxID=2587128 RepID=UPI00160C388A|nr:hypothetical protein [Pseudomonas sp. AS2.8]MBB2897036.1 hypothetical protein [Pseudomonas sp. AS2.8]
MDYLLELLLRLFCFPIGWPVMKLLSWGRYPKPKTWFAETPQSDWTSGIGLLVWTVVLLAVLKQFEFF